MRLKVRRWVSGRSLASGREMIWPGAGWMLLLRMVSTGRARETTTGSERVRPSRREMLAVR